MTTNSTGPLGSIPGVTATGPAGPSDSGAPAGGDQGTLQNPFAIPEPAPRREHSGRVPSPREVRGHASASIGRDSQGREFSTSTVGSQPEVPSGGNERKTSGPVRFQTPGGRTILAKEADSSSLVVGRDGRVVSDLGSLLASGLIEQTGDGYRMTHQEDAGNAGDPDDNTPGDQDGGHQGPQQAAQLADQQTEQLVQYLSAEHTSLYDSIVNAVSEPGFDGILSVEKIEDVAHSLSVNTETARAAIAQVAAGFRQQYSEHIYASGLDSASLEQWLATDDLDPDVKRIFSDAVKRQAQDRDLSGFDMLVSRYLAELAQTDPQMILNAQFGPGMSVYRASNGELVLRHPEFGDVGFDTAARRGWLKPSRGGQKHGQRG